MTAGRAAPDPDPLRLAREIVGFSRRATRHYNRARSSAGDLFIDVYSNALAGICVVMMIASLAVALRSEIAARSIGGTSLVAEHRQVVPAGIVWMLLACLALVGVLVLARRLGPVAVGRAEGTWWLPLPIDRCPMVRPAFLRRLLAVGALASAAWVPFSFLTAFDRSPWGHATSAVTFGGAAVSAVLGAAALQLHPASGVLRAGVLVGLVPVAVLPFITPAVWPPVLVLGLTAVLLAYVVPRAGDVRGAELQRGGAVSGHAAASVFLLDLNELRRSLVPAPSTAGSLRGSRIYRRRTRLPLMAVIRADVVAFLRLQPPPTAALVWLVLCIGVTVVTPALPVLLQLLVILVAGCLVTAGTGTVARRTSIIPELDALLPVSPALVRCSRMLMPVLAMAAWTAALTGALVILGAGTPLLVLLGVLAGCGMGAGATRAATRPSTDWTTPPVETPFGPVPRDQLSSLLRGTDMTVLSMVPLLLALYLGAVHPWLILAQVVAGSIAVIVQASTPSTR